MKNKAAAMMATTAADPIAMPTTAPVERLELDEDPPPTEVVDED